jgi:hypothetical protein
MTKTRIFNTNEVFEGYIRGIILVCLEIQKNQIIEERDKKKALLI